MSEIKLILTEVGVKEAKAKEILGTISELETRAAGWESIANLQITDASDKATMKAAEAARKTIKKDRLEADKFLKAKREEVQVKMAEYTSEDKAYMKISQYYERVAKAHESKLEEIEKYAEKIENERLEKLRTERTEKLSEVVDNPELYGEIHKMSEEAFNSMYESFAVAKKMREDAARAEEEARLKAEEEAKAKAAEEARINGIFQSRREKLAEYSHLEYEGKGTLKIDSTEEEAKAIYENAKKAKLIWDEEQMKLRKEAERARLAQLELDRLEREKKEKEEAEARQQAEVQARRDELKKAGAKEKLMTMLDVIAMPDIKIPEFDVSDNEKAALVKEDIIKKFLGFKDWAKKEINKL